LPDGSPERAVFINNSIGSWSGYAPEEAIGWLVDQGLAESEESDYFRMILRVWSYNDPPAAFSYLSSAQAYNLTSRAFKEELDGIFGSWARKDPEQAVNASIMIPEGRAAETAFLISYSNWLDSSPMSAANWAGALPGGDLKDRSIKLLIPKIRETGVKLAWAEKINSDKTRIEICQKIVGTQSEEAVVEILNDNELKLDSQFKAEIINLLINRGH
jgi:hypothetical protein